MNRSFLIIMIPVMLVALGYIVVLHYMGFAPGYGRLIFAVAIFFGGIWRLGRRTGRKAESSRE
jgi:hypothetical protein